MPEGLQSIGLQRFGHDWSNWVHTHIYTHVYINAHMYTHTLTHTYLHVCVYIHPHTMHICLYILTSTHTHIYVCIYIYFCSFVWIIFVFLCDGKNMNSKVCYNPGRVYFYYKWFWGFFWPVSKTRAHKRELWIPTRHFFWQALSKRSSSSQNS